VLLCIGIIILIVGFILLLAPNLVSDIMMLLLAIGLILIGILTAMGGLADKGDGKVRILPVIVGAIFVIVGIYAALNLDDTADIVMIIIGILVLIAGIIRVIAGGKQAGFY